MSYSIATTTATGSSNLVTVPFDYLTKDDVHITLDGVAVADTDLVWNSASVIKLPTTPAAGVQIKCYRLTNLATLDYVFSTGRLDHNDLNNVNRQLLFVVQEATDVVGSASIPAGSVTMDKITNIATASILGRTTAGVGPPEVLGAAAVKALLGLVPGSNIQAWSSILTDIAGTTFVQGDILYYNGVNLVRLAAGTSGNFLKTQGAGANPVWAAIVGGGDMLRANNLSDLLSFSSARTNLGLVIGTNVQAYDATLDAWAAFNTNGLLTQTGPDTFTARSLTAPAAGLTIANPGGSGGNPLFALANDLAALEALGSTGLAARTAADTWAQRSIVGTASQIVVANADGAAGNPTISLDPTVNGTVFALTDGATPALDASQGGVFTLAAAGDRTVAIPTNAKSGQKIILVHLASGGIRTLALNTGAGGFRYGSTISGLTATASGKKDYIGCIYNATDSFWDVVAYSKGY